jgi:hypothetical protein
MGVTGSGKSTLISKCAGGGAQAGHGLTSCELGKDSSTAGTNKTGDQKARVRSKHLISSTMIKLFI